MAFLCASLISFSQERIPEKKQAMMLDNCVELGLEAAASGFDPMLMVSIAHTESRFNKRAVSKAGAVGIMQVLPKYFCPKKGKCDYTKAGLTAWERWSKGRTKKEALCRYNSGRKCSDSKRARYYSRVVLRKYWRLDAALINNSCPVCACGVEEGC